MTLFCCGLFIIILNTKVPLEFQSAEIISNGSVLMFLLFLVTVAILDS